MSKDARILIVEDQYLVADSLKRAVLETGAQVVGPTPDVAKALKLLKEQAFDLAILDVNLGEDTAYSFADALDEAKVPYIFVTGYDHEGMRPEYRHRPRLQKPVSHVALQNVIKESLREPG